MLADRFFDAMRARMKRREWVANPADPTHVLQYRAGGHPRRWEVRFLTSFEVETTFRLRGWTWRTYGGRLAGWFVGGLEDSYTRQWAQGEDDPMGYPEN